MTVTEMLMGYAGILVFALFLFCVGMWAKKNEAGQKQKSE